jgi:hypothetical protein
MFKVGEIVKYAPQFCGEGEEFYIHMVKEADRGHYLIETLNSLLTLAPTERVTEDMIQAAKKYEVVLNRKAGDRAYIITDTENHKFFAGYDFMGSVEWVDDDADASEMGKAEAERIASDLEAAD